MKDCLSVRLFFAPASPSPQQHFGVQKNVNDPSHLFQVPDPLTDPARLLEYTPDRVSDRFFRKEEPQVANQPVPTPTEVRSEATRDVAQLG